MAKEFSAILILCTLIVAATAASGPKSAAKWAKNLLHAPEKLTKLHFYSHHLHGATAVTVARAPTTDASPTFFGLLDTRDDPLTAGPEESSERVGYAQGISAAASLEEIVSFDSFTFVFTREEYNGSTLAVVGTCGLFSPSCEAAVVGGSGVFRLARGVATMRAYDLNFTTGKASVEIKVAALHYGG